MGGGGTYDDFGFFGEVVGRSSVLLVDDGGALLVEAVFVPVFFLGPFVPPPPPPLGAPDEAFETRSGCDAGVVLLVLLLLLT